MSEEGEPMRNVKRLWGVIGCMSICVLVLFFMLIARSSTLPDPTDPPKQQQHTEKDDNRIVATIGTRVIKIRELQAALESHYGAELLKQILDREAIHLEGIEAGINIEDAQIERELKRMQQGYASEEQFYTSMFEQLGMSKQELRDDVFHKLLLESIATKHITISDQVVDEYIRTHPEEFKEEVELKIQMIIVSTKEQANKVRADLIKGMDFAILARDRSLDDMTANSGGELGWVEEDDPFVLAPVLEAAKQLKAKEISKPVAVEQGFAIVHLMDRRTKPNLERALVRESVRKELALREAPPLKEIVNKLRSKWGAVIVDTQFK